MCSCWSCCNYCRWEKVSYLLWCVLEHLLQVQDMSLWLTLVRINWLVSAATQQHELLLVQTFPVATKTCVHYWQGVSVIVLTSCLWHSTEITRTNNYCVTYSSWSHNLSADLAHSIMITSWINSLFLWYEIDFTSYIYGAPTFSVPMHFDVCRQRSSV